MIRNRFVVAVLLVVVCMGTLFCEQIADWVLRVF